MEANTGTTDSRRTGEATSPLPVIFENREAALGHVPDFRAAFEDDAATFSQLFFAYYAKNPARADDPTERTIVSDAMAYLLGDLWALFEKEYGRVRDQYWCSEVRAAAVYTVRDPKRGLGASFHATVNWRPVDYELVTEAIALDELELATRFLPEGVTRTRSVKLVYDAYSTALAAMDHPVGSETPESRAHELQGVRQQVQLARSFFRAAGQRYAQAEYFRGMLFGFLPLLATCAIVATFLWAISASAAGVPGRITAWALAGSIGAMLSVMVRITRDDFRLNWEASREELWTAGAIRPFVGAVLGAAVPMLIIGGIAAITAELNTTDDAKSRFADFGFALAAGFSERWAPDLLARQPSVLGAGNGESPIEGRSRT